MDLPVKLEEVYIGEVIDISYEGKGVVKVEGFTIFTDRGIIGDKVEFKIEKIKKNFAEATVIKILSYSNKRIDSKCFVSDTCGGCQLQSMDYLYQLELKEEKVKNDLARIGNFKNVKVNKIIPSRNIYRYRNNVQIPIGFHKGNPIIGHYKKASHEIVDTKECLIQEEIADKLVDILRTFIKKNRIKVYNKRQNTGTIRHIIIRTASKSKDTMVVIVTKGDKFPYKDEFINLIKKEVPEVKGIFHNINNKRNSQVMGNITKKIYGKDYIIDEILGLRFKISPESFFQVNTSQAEEIYEKILDYADLKGGETVVDLYCGIGSISLALARKASRVYGVEIVESAINDAKENAKENGLNNLGFFTGKSEDILPQFKSQGLDMDLVVVDPPRRGCDENLLSTIVNMDIKKMIYVSCNPATLARDLKYLSDFGYNIEEIQPVDMFPQTTHVECVALLEKKIM